MDTGSAKAGRRSLRRREEPLDGRPEVLHVHEEGIVALDGGQLLQHDLGAALGEACGQFALLVDREQDVGLDADDQRALDAQAGEDCSHGSAVVGEVEQVAGPREEEVAVGIELAGEFPRLRLEVGLDRKLRRDAIPAPALPGDAIVASTWVGQAESVRFERFVEILRASDRRVLARTRTLWCPISRTTGKVTRVGDDVRQVFSRD